MPVQKHSQEIYNNKLQNGTFIGDWPSHGIGKFIYKSGDVYEGEWKDGKRHGIGTYTYADGDVYEGEWKDGKRHGKVTHTYADGSVTVQGNYENGVCIDFEKIIIKDTQGVEHCFFKEGGIL